MFSCFLCMTTRRLAIVQRSHSDLPPRPPRTPRFWGSSSVCSVVIVIAWVVAAAGVRAAGPGTTLIDAIKAGDHNAVRALLKDTAAANAREIDGTTALHWAVRADDRVVVDWLLKAGASATSSNRYGVTPLSLAAANGNAAMIEALLADGADAGTASREGQTVLMTAARTGNADAVAALLAHGADPNAREEWLGETALMQAAAQNQGAAIALLAARGADVNARSAASTIPTLTAPTIGIITMEFPKGSWTPLMFAAREGGVDATRALARAGANLNAQASDGVTPLMIAIINAQYDVAAALIDAGADPNLADSTGMTALYAAVDMHTLPWMQGRPDPKSASVHDEVAIVRMLLDRGANPNPTLKGPLLQRNHTAGDPGLGEAATPFMRAAKGGDITLMRLLLEKGADPARTLKNHTTPLMLAAGTGWRDGGGAFPTRDRATEEGTIAAIDLCLSRGADINATNDAGDTPLHAAAGRGADAVIRFLVAHGAKLDAKNRAGRTPLDVAASRRERVATAALLRELAATP